MFNFNDKKSLLLRLPGLLMLELASIVCVDRISHRPEIEEVPRLNLNWFTVPVSILVIYGAYGELDVRICSKLDTAFFSRTTSPRP